MGPRSSINYALDQLNAETLTAVIELHKKSKDTVSGLYQRYLQKGLAIQSRTVEDVAKPNNQLANDFRGYIVDQVVGYLFGNEVSYTVDAASFEGQEATFEAFRNMLEDLIVTNEIADLDAELATYMSACGYAARLMYLEDIENEDAELEESEFPAIRLMNIPAYEVFFIYNGNKRTHAIRYQELASGDDEEAPLLVTVYTDTELTRYQTNEDGELTQTESKSHGFQRIPVALFQNNEQEMGDFEKVEPLIDAYDIVTSDNINEVESFAHAYLALEGIEMSQDEAKKAKQTGVLVLPESMNGGSSAKAYFITKNINDTFLENAKNTLVSNIHKFSSSVNMADESFSGSAQSGESRKWKLTDLEAKAGKKARKFAKGLREQFRVICTNWKVLQDGIDYKKMSFKFSRNVPNDRSQAADFASKMKGIISDETLFENLDGIVEDVQYEKELILKEQQELTDNLGSLDDTGADTTTDSNAVAE